MPVSIKISNRVIKPGATAKFLVLNPLLYIRDLTISVNGYLVDSSRYRRQVSLVGETIIMPADDNDLIAGLTAADMYAIFYTDNATPKAVPLADIVSNYNIFKDGNMLVVFRPESDFLQDLTGSNIYSKQL